MVALPMAAAPTILRLMDTAQLLLALGLVFGTLDYGLMIRRRAAVRRRQLEAEAAQQIGLQGLVRVLLVDR
jgi:hypothetical protein